MLVLGRSIGEKVNIYVGEIRIQVQVLPRKRHDSNSMIGLGFTAPKEVSIVRAEIDGEQLSDGDTAAGPGGPRG